MKLYTIVTILVSLSLLATHVVHAENLYDVFVGGWGLNVKNESDASVIELTSCGNVSTACLQATINNENDFLGFRLATDNAGGGWDASKFQILHFDIAVTAFNQSNIPVVKVSVLTSPTPTFIYLNSTKYLDSTDIYGRYQSGRIRLSDMGVKDVKIFNGIYFRANVRNSSFTVANVYLTSPATTLCASLSAIVLGLIVTVLML
ncbi:hypothetical protein SAMD00019534_037310 [Acytostelium subglobosum LB1]|uniref:hypothetical protein n=1 Tax=Acytostelium subglobosum LB1 TaxID=1410327 RepID=UPI0006447BCA|nr:hypothetical protein SAMD00019534_037310 [Acytostelium subglobosum LB1]GAM20556.1 hypothetical protein SAMD00019534_037310 [Acytostelium subglobosum LB1]|eukprot:XP_012760077.1 hypothetical protein SAMD00019534_037310 [Acytostelium subglobosum LB1]